MTETQAALNYALKTYGEAMTAYYAQNRAPQCYDNMCFWQQQVAHCAQELAEEQSLGYTPELVGMLVDPPSGWRYGFPKQFNPKPGMTFAMWLLQNGYPERDLSLALTHSRFIGPVVEHDGRGPG